MEKMMLETLHLHLEAQSLALAILLIGVVIAFTEIIIKERFM